MRAPGASREYRRKPDVRSAQWHPYSRQGWDNAPEIEFCIRHNEAFLPTHHIHAISWSAISRRPASQCPPHQVSQQLRCRESSIPRRESSRLTSQKEFPDTFWCSGVWPRQPNRGLVWRAAPFQTMARWIPCKSPALSRQTLQPDGDGVCSMPVSRSEEHTSELQSPMYL